MNDKRAEQIGKISTAIMKEFASKGKVLEGGWAAFAMVNKVADRNPFQVKELREAYYSGAQHLYASLMAALDPGDDATPKDLDLMAAIDKELTDWVKEMKGPQN